MSEAGNSNSTKHTPLRIEPVPNGGFIISEAGWSGADSSRFCGPLLACTTIGEALDFIKGRFAPVEQKAAPAPMQAPEPFVEERRRRPPSASQGYPIEKADWAG